MKKKIEQRELDDFDLELIEVMKHLYQHNGMDDRVSSHLNKLNFFTPSHLQN